METEIGGWLTEISKVLDGSSLASLSERLGIPRSTVALRRRYPKTVTLYDLERMVDEGLLDVKMRAK